VTAALKYLTARVKLKLSFSSENRNGTNEGHKLFSFKNIIKISSVISSECTRNLISSLNTATCNPVLGLHMEDFQE